MADTVLSPGMVVPWDNNLVYERTEVAPNGDILHIPIIPQIYAYDSFTAVGSTVLEGRKKKLMIIIGE